MTQRSTIFFSHCQVFGNFLRFIRISGGTLDFKSYLINSNIYIQGIRYLQKKMNQTNSAKSAKYSHEECRLTMILPEIKDVTIRIPHMRYDALHTVLLFSCAYCGHDDHVSSSCCLAQMETNITLKVKNPSSSEEGSVNSTGGPML